MNNSTLAQLEGTAGSSRKFTQSQGNSQPGSKYSQKVEGAGQGNEGTSRSQQK